MTPLWIFSIHLALLVGGLAGLPVLARAGVAAEKLQRTALLYSLATGGFLFAVSDPGNLLEDFRVAYHGAGAAVLDGPQALAPMIERGVDGFVNLPIVAYLFVPFALLPKMSMAIAAFTLLGVVCVHASWKMLVQHAGLDALRASQLLILLATSGPLLYSFKEGNISHLLLLPLIMTLVLLRQGRELAAGMVLGLLAVLKPPLLLLGAYFVLRAQWQVVLGGLLAGALTALASLTLFGWDFHVRWYELCIAPFGRDPMPAFNVQSLQAFVSRLEQGAAGLFVWNTLPLTLQGRRLAEGLGAVIVLALLAIVLAPRSLRGPDVQILPAQAVRELEFMMVLLLACIVSPLAWTHYYAWVLLPAALVLGRDTGSGAWRAVIWLALTLAANPVISVRMADGWLAELHARTSASAVLFGGLLMLLVLGRLRWRLVAVDAEPRNSRVGTFSGLRRGEAPQSERQ